MRKAQVEVGKSYAAKVSGRYVRVVILNESIYGGWNALNTKTNRVVRIRTGGRLTRIPDNLLHI